MASLTLRSISKKFGSHLVVDHVDLDVCDREFVVLLGPSGCGKTTVLRMIAGLEKPTAGELIVEGRVINSVPPQRRDMAMVFQNYALYAHLTVFDNLAFGLRMRGTPKDQIEPRVRATAEMLRIGHLLDRRPQQLSGGERQRVALGRAMVRQPQLFLMDEPLSNLDALLRIHMRTEILQLCRKIRATVLYVTHDQTEAMTMGQRIVLFKGGQVQQVDTPLQIYYQPANRFVAEFVGTPPMNFVDVDLVCEDGKIWAKAEGFSLDLSGSAYAARIKQVPGAPRTAVLGVRPEHLSYHATKQVGLSISGIAEVIEPLGRETLVYVSIGSHLVRSLVDPYDAPKRGDCLSLQFDVSKVQLFDKESGSNLMLLSQATH